MMQNRLHNFTKDIPTHFPTRQEWLDEQYDQKKMIRKKDLVSFEIYCGTCRNANMAMWYGFEQEFIHFRTKFGSEFTERIDHPEDELENADIFIPHIKYKDMKDIGYRDNFRYQSYVLTELHSSFFFLEKEYEKLRLLEQRIKNGEKI